MILKQPGLHGLRGMGSMQTYTYDDGSTITYDDGLPDSTGYNPAVTASNATDLPVVNIPANTTPPTMGYDPGQIIRAGVQLYRYIQQSNGQWVPQPYMTMPTSQPNTMMMLLLAAAAFALLS